MTEKTLLPQRHPNKDFFIADILDAVPKSDMGSLENPFFSLSKKPDMTERHYEHNGNTLTVIPSGRGMATIWDKDILIYCVSQLVAGVGLGRDPSQTIQLTAYDLLVSTNRNTGGRNYKLLEDALNRLRGTTINTNLVTNGALGHEVLSINPDYFRLRGGIERRVYELARKHCGKQSSWRINIDLLYKKSGVRSPLKQFRHEIKRIVASDITPDYRLRYNAKKDQITFYGRKGAKAAKAEFDDQMKMLF